MTTNESRRIDRKPLLAIINTLAEQINNYGIFTDLFCENNLPKIDINQWFELFDKNKDLVTIDARSENEFAVDHLPGAINFPILNNAERDEVGFLFKQVSPQAAYFWAEQIAKQKNSEILKLVSDYQGKQIVVNCWRGGGRSTALAYYLNKHGLPCSKLIGGYKSYRSAIYHAFYQDGAGLLNFIVLTGLTGCGKTEIIEHLSGKVPVLDIESAARHASSLFGHLRYIGKKFVNSQTEFENRLFAQLLNKCNMSGVPYLTEGESKAVSTFQIPDTLYKRLKVSPAIKVNASLESRIRRIELEYFSGDKAVKIAETLNNSRFFKIQFGNQEILRLNHLLETGRIHEFCEWFLVEYYDKRYSKMYSNFVATVDSDNLDQAIEEILAIMLKNKI